MDFGVDRDKGPEFGGLIQEGNQCLFHILSEALDVMDLKNQMLHLEEFVDSLLKDVMLRMKRRDQ